MKLSSENHRQIRHRHSIRADDKRRPEMRSIAVALDVLGRGGDTEDVASVLSLSGDRAAKIVRHAKEVSLKDRDIPVLSEADLEAMRPVTADAFKLFYEAFSPYDTLPDHHYEIAKCVLENRDSMTNVAPKAAKSWVVSEWIPIWLVCQNRDISVMVVTESDSLALTFADYVAVQLTENEALLHYYGQFKPEKDSEGVWRPSEGRIRVTGRSAKRKGSFYSYLALGSKQKLMGNLFDVCIIDDPQSPSSARSETERDTLVKKIREEIFSRKIGADSRVAVVGQRLHPADIYSVLQQIEHRGQKIFKVFSMPAILDYEKKTTLWPESEDFEWEELMRQKSRVGEAAFEALYMQNPSLMVAGLQITPELWAKALDDDRPADLPLQLYWNAPKCVTQAGSLDVKPYSTVLAIDPGSPLNQTGTAYVLADVVENRHNRREFEAYIRRMWTTNGDQLVVIQNIEDSIKNDGAEYVVYENVVWSQWFETSPEIARWKLAGIQFLSHNTVSTTKHADTYGVLGLSLDFEKARIRIPYGDETAIEQADSLWRQIVSWGSRAADDLVMALWILKFNCNRYLPRKMRVFDGHFKVDPTRPTTRINRLVTQEAMKAVGARDEWEYIHLMDKQRRKRAKADAEAEYYRRKLAERKRSA